MHMNFTSNFKVFQTSGSDNYFQLIKSPKHNGFQILAVYQYICCKLATTAGQNQLKSKHNGLAV